MAVKLQKAGKTSRHPKRLREASVLLASTVAAFVGSIAYQAHVARPSAPAWQPPVSNDPPASERTTDYAPPSGHDPPSASTPVHSDSSAVTAMPSGKPPGISVNAPPSIAHEDAAGSPLPITVNVRDRRSVGLIDAILYNSSANPLDLVLESGNPSTGSATRITLRLDPAESRHVGRDEGLFMNPGETLTVSSPPYQDLRTEVR